MSTGGATTPGQQMEKLFHFLFFFLQDDLKIIRKRLTPGRYPVQKICPPKKRRQSQLDLPFR